MNTDLPELKRAIDLQQPPLLAQYKQRTEYTPQYGDYFIWSGWITTWHGLVVNYDRRTDELYVLFAGVPFLLFTMSEAEQEKETRKLRLADVKSAKPGKFAIQQHRPEQNAIIWYI